MLPSVNVEPTPLLFQLPAMFHEPVVTVRTPLVPPFIANVVMLTVDAFAVRMPPVPMLRAPALLRPSAKSAVARAVVLVVVPSVTDNVPPQNNPRVAIVNVCAVAADDVNVTLLNSDSAKFAPAKVIVPPVAELKVTVPVPLSQPAASVEAFVHVPVTVHDSEPKAIADDALEMFTFPVIETVPDVLVRSPLDIVRLAAVTVNVDLANVPPEIVSAFVTTVLVANVIVPADTARAENVLSVDSNVIVAVALNV